MAQNTDSENDSDLSERQHRIKQTIEDDVNDLYLRSIAEEMGFDREWPPTPQSHGPCDRCERNDDRVIIRTDEYERYICTDCANQIFSEIDDHYWYDRFSRGHYNIIAAFLRSLDEVWCVKDHAYEGGEMWVHTPYFDTTVVEDVITYFGDVRHVHIERADDSCWECMDDHGDCVEINLDFGGVSVHPLPEDVLAEQLWSKSYYDVEFVDEDSKLFDRDE